MTLLVCRLGPRQVIDVGTIPPSEGTPVPVKITPRAHGDRRKVEYRLTVRVSSNEIEGMSGAFSIEGKVKDGEVEFEEPEPVAPQARGRKKGGLCSCFCPSA